MRLTFTKPTLLLVLSLLAYDFAHAQLVVRPHTLAYSENLKGGTVMFGNTMMHVLDANGNPDLSIMNEPANPNNGIGIGYATTGNDDQYMDFIDIDGSTGPGAGTSNSSSADLVLPAGTNTIRFARLYWGGKTLPDVLQASPDTLRKIKIRKGTTGAYTTALAPVANVDFIDLTTDIVYQSYVDITQFVNASGSGTYTVADIAATPGFTNFGGQYAGWAIVVAYENPTQPYNSVRVYDGYAQVYNAGATATLQVTLDGLNVPNNPLAANEAVMATMSWEGDANLYDSPTNPQGDYIKINNVALSNAVNPITNFWNGSISRDGVYVSTKNPDYANQLGIDIDEVNVGTGYNILPNATSLSVEFGTEADQYFPSVFTFNIRMKEPLVSLDKTVSDADGSGFVDPNEQLTYVLSGSNTGAGIAYNTVITDTIPANVSYVPNTLEVIDGAGVPAGFKTDAADTDEALAGTNNGKTYVKFFIGAGATGTSGGQLGLDLDGGYSVRFKVMAGAIPGSITNTARITANSQAGDVFTDDGTAVIGDNGGPVPVKLISFQSTLDNMKGLLRWTTSAEFNCDYYIVERSTDAVHFETRQRISGNGSSLLVHNYQCTDALNTSSRIFYYRLKILDQDGKYGFSKIIALKTDGSMNESDGFVFANPFVNDIKVSMTSSSEQIASFRLITVDGKVMLNRKIALSTGGNIVVLTGLNNLTAGNYFLEIVRMGEDKIVKQVMKR
ncbi:MAG: T9SS type A sorting domain-containing protein [Ferruginibacter sp.]